MVTGPNEQTAFLQKSCQRLTNNTKLSDKLLVVPRKPQKTAQIFDAVRFGPLSNGLDFEWVSSYALGINDMT